MQTKFKPRRRTAAEILSSIPTERPMPVFCCPRCGVCGCRIELHEEVPAVRVPLVARLMA